MNDEPLMEHSVVVQGPPTNLELPRRHADPIVSDTKRGRGSLIWPLDVDFRGIGIPRIGDKLDDGDSRIGHDRAGVSTKEPLFEQRALAITLCSRAYGHLRSSRWYDEGDHYTVSCASSSQSSPKPLRPLMRLLDHTVPVEDDGPSGSDHSTGR